MHTPDPQPEEPGQDSPAVEEPDDGTTEAEEDEGEGSAARSYTLAG